MMKKSTPFILTIFSGCALVAVAVALLFWKSSSAERETQPTRPATAQEMPRKSARSDRPATQSQRNKTGEAPLSPAARALLAEIDQSLAEFLQMESGDEESLLEKDQVHRRIRGLLKDYREAGGRSSDLLDLASKLVAQGQDQSKWLLDHFVLEAAKINGGDVAAWWDTQAPDYLVESKAYFRKVAQEWIQSEPREAMRWVEDNFDRLDTVELAYIVWKWDRRDMTGAAAWVEGQMQSGNPLISGWTVLYLARNWAQHDPAGATQWVESLPEGMHYQGYSGIAIGWPEDSLPEAADWLAERRGVGAYDSAREYLAKRLTKTDPVGAIDLAIDVTNAKKSDALIIEAARVLYRSDPETVIDWLPDSGLSEEARRAILTPDS